jgi:sulfur carrier protein
MIILNGEIAELPIEAGLLGALGRLGVEPDARGIAVAVDGEVVPRSAWETFVLCEGVRVEVLTAMQGG